MSGCVLPWVPETRYLGVYIVNSKSFKCSIDAAKRAFYRSANAIFGKIGRIASEEVTLQSLQVTQSRYVPLLLYGLVAWPLNKSQVNSLDFVINRFLWSHYVIGQAIIFCPVISIFLLSFFPRLISAAVDWMSTILPHMVWP